MYWNVRSKLFYEADDGAGGGSDPAPQGDGKDDGKVVFTPEQQAKIDELIGKAFAKGAAKAGKEAEQNKQTEAEKLAEERAAFENEKARTKTEILLTKEGFLLNGENVSDDNDALIAMLTDLDEKVVDTRIAALKKLLQAKVNAGVDERLRGNKPPLPNKSDDKTKQSINDILRAATRKNI